MRVRTRCHSVAWLAAVVVLLLRTDGSVAAAAERPQNVLILHAYHQGLAWTDNIQAGLDAGFAEAARPVQLHVEYMDSKRHTPDSLFPHLVTLYAEKYGTTRPDLVVVSDNNALSFALTHRQQLFAGVPVVFCGINNFGDEMLEGHADVTGVVEDIAVAETIDVMLRLHPDCRRIAVINDMTPTGQANHERLRQVMPAFRSRVEFVEWQGIGRKDLTRSLQALGPDAAVLLFTYHLNRDGERFASDEFLALVSGWSSRPVYAFWDHFLGRGIVGGQVVSGKEQGLRAAQLGLSILAGEPAANLPIVLRSPNVPMFDFAQLKRFGVKDSLLPATAAVINRPPSFYALFKYRIWTGIAVIVILALTTVFLAVNTAQRHRAAQSLRESETRLRELAEMLPEVIYEADTEGRLTFVNHAGLAALGYSASALQKGLAVTQLLAPDARTAFEQQTVRTTETNANEGVELTALRTDGTMFPVLSFVAPVLQAHHPVGLRGIMIDITERKKAEDARVELEARIQHAQKLESLGILAGGIAHDFNNLLVGILGNADLALARVPEDAPVRREIHEVRDAALRAAELTNQMLAYSGKGRFVVRPVNLNEVVRQMEPLLGASRSKSALLAWQLADELPAVEADLAQLRQVVMNLITNASDAIGDDPGTITVATGVVDADEEYLREITDLDPLPAGRYVFLELTDTGCGMDKATQARIFEPFFSTKETGRGLGMAAVTGIVRGHSGTIKVYSEPGRGTTIKVLFPASDQPAVPLAQPVEHTGDERRGNGTILVIDDERSVRVVAGELFRDRGFQTLVAEDGERGLEAFRQHTEDIVLVLLDMTMPGIDGAETFRLLRQIRPDVKVILSSGYNEQEATRRFAGKGLAGFLQKPYLAATLLNKVWEVLDYGDNS